MEYLGVALILTLLSHSGGHALVRLVGWLWDRVLYLWLVVVPVDLLVYVVGYLGVSLVSDKRLELTDC